jgi:hypothetical protein
MPIVPLRELGKVGVITDVDPFDIPINSFSFAKNVRFENGKLERGSVFRKVSDILPVPRHLIGYLTVTGSNRLHIGSIDGRLWDWSNDDLTEITPQFWIPQTAEDASWTSTILQNIVYVNRGDRLPAYRSKDGNGAFETIPTTAEPVGWEPSTRCRVLRSFAGVLMAFNVTKAGVTFPTMIKWSDFPYYDQVPPNWDYASPETSAGENTLANMAGEIIDALPLRNRMMIYGDTETHFAEFIGGNDMFRWDRQFDNGVIGTNCVVEVNNEHFVFGDNQIWKHDGTTYVPIGRGRINDFVYRTMDREQSNRFFVVHNQRMNEVYFCYVSNDRWIDFSSDNGIGCNRAAIYNYASDCWYFADLPYVTCHGFAAPVGGMIFDETMTSYDAFGGSFSSIAGDTKTNVIFGSQASSIRGLPNAIRAFEGYSTVSTTYPIDIPANSVGLIERGSLDMDELRPELRGYKLVSSIYPQGRLDVDGAPLSITFGAADHPNREPTWGVPQTFDNTFYKLDFNIAGRYLAFRAIQNDLRPFSLSGFDFDVTLLGRY